MICPGLGPGLGSPLLRVVFFSRANVVAVLVLLLPFLMRFIFYIFLILFSKMEIYSVDFDVTGGELSKSPPLRYGIMIYARNSVFLAFLMPYEATMTISQLPLNATAV